MTLQHSQDDQQGFIENQLPKSMGDCGIQRIEYEHAQRLHGTTFDCDAEVYGVYPDK
jgi:hypothetical protein